MMKFFMVESMFIFPMIMFCFFVLVGIVLLFLANKYGGLKNVLTVLLEGKSSLNSSYLSDKNTRVDNLSVLKQRLANGEITLQEFEDLKQFV